jgi:CRISPR-associated protein Cst2
MYELSLNIRIELQAHSLSNIGSNGSIRTLPRRQLLANGTEVDAISGNIAKRHHAMVLAEYFEETDVPLCPACAARDGRRAAALLNHSDYKNINMEQIVRGCGMCDIHGFLVTAKKASEKDGVEARRRLGKHSLIEFSFGLALPESQTETNHLFTRSGREDGDGQMLFKQPGRSGSYGMCIRYKCAGIGVNTDRWDIILDDNEERTTRHRAVLCALRDSILSPNGALATTMLPHITGLVGAVVIQESVGRAPIYSPLSSDFVIRLTAMQKRGCTVSKFESVDEFSVIMEKLIEHSKPYLPGSTATKAMSKASSSAQ